MSLRVTTCSPVCPHELVQSKHRGARERAGREREAVCARAHTWYPRSPDAAGPGTRGPGTAHRCPASWEARVRSSAGPRAALWGAGSLGAGSWPHWLPAPRRYTSQSRHAEARELMCSGALLFFSHGQVSCGRPQVSRLEACGPEQGHPGRGLSATLNGLWRWPRFPRLGKRPQTPGSRHGLRHPPAAPRPGSLTPAALLSDLVSRGRSVTSVQHAAARSLRTQSCVSDPAALVCFHAL